MSWDVSLSAKVQKNLQNPRKVPKGINEIFQVLLRELEVSGPSRVKWPNYGRLARNRRCHHCHLQKGNPTYVAIWRTNEGEGSRCFMLEHMKESTTTEYVEMRYRIPLHKLGEIQELMASYGVEETKGDCGSIPWKEIFPDFNPSIALRGARKKGKSNPARIGEISGNQSNPHLRNGKSQKANWKRNGKEVGYISEC